jgi:hypothetical protein
MRFTMLVACLVVGCSAPTVVVNNSVGAMKEQATANKVAGYAKSTPPDGAMSMGMMTAPKAGNATIPITNVEVYLFSANIDDAPNAETLYWATTGDVIYVWGAFGLVCVDDNGNPTGETGAADFIYEANGTSYGWMVATDSCGYTTYFGCSAAGGPEVCGGCDFNDQFILCAAAS